MAVSIVGTLEMIYTVGADAISEPLAVNMTSPTEKALDLRTGLVFTNPPVDVRDTLEPYLATTYGLTNITRVGSPRAGAMAEWTAVLGGITRAIVLWAISPLRQEGVEWSPAPAAQSTILALTALNLADSTGALHTIGATPTALTYDSAPIYTQAQVDALVATIPKTPIRGSQNLTETRTTAGDISFTTGTATVSGLLPNTSYNLTVDVVLWLFTASAGQFQTIINYPTGGSLSFSASESATTALRSTAWKTANTRMSDASGNITAQAGIRWVSGSITSSRADVILTVYGPA